MKLSREFDSPAKKGIETKVGDSVGISVGREFDSPAKKGIETMLLRILPR